MLNKEASAKAPFLLRSLSSARPRAGLSSYSAPARGTQETGDNMEAISSSEWKRLRLICYHRDKQANAPCGICKGAEGPIDYSAKPSSTPTSYEPDHILPRHTHPELGLVAGNIQAAHRKCNRAKGKRATLNPLGKPSREW